MGRPDEKGRLGLPIPVLAVSHSLDRTAKDREAVGDLFREYLCTRDVPDQPMAVGGDQRDVKVIHDNSQRDRLLAEAGDLKGRRDIRAVSRVLNRNGAALPEGRAGNLQVL